MPDAQTHRNAFRTITSSVTPAGAKNSTAIYELPTVAAATMFSVQAFVSGGLSTKASMKFQGSFDGDNWYTIGKSTFIAATTATKTTVTNGTGTARFSHVRVVINSFTTKAGSTAADTTTVTAWIGVRT